MAINNPSRTLGSVDEDVERLLKVREELEVDKLFRALVNQKGSDLHLKVGRPPFVRVAGILRQLNYPSIEREEMVRLLVPMMDKRQRKIFEEEGGVDFAYSVMVGSGEGEEKVSWRFRVNILQQLGNIGLVARKVDNEIPVFADLNLPSSIEELCKFDQGMVLLAGITGSGKTTTIASMLNWINKRDRKHILTLEDPVEFVYTDDKCLINQREVGIDVVNFEIAMKHAVREDPDIMLVGEMRDAETFETAMQAAETGHLVFGTIHASTAPSCILRILDLFPANKHKSLRASMAFNMRGIVAQKLLKSIHPEFKRVPAVEIMTFNTNIKKFVEREEDGKLPDAIKIGAEDGMQDFTMSLKQLIDDELIDRQEAFRVAPNVEALKMALKGINVTQPGIL